MNDWFTIDHIDKHTHIISEYRHWEETHAYLLNGTKRSLLIDTGLGICNIYEEVQKLTELPVTAVATHIHWDHIGGHAYFPDFYAHENELDWLNGQFPLTLDQIKDMVVDRCDLPEGYRVENYRFFQGTPTRVLKDSDRIDPGAYLASLERIAALPVKQVFPAHHSLDIQPSILQEMRQAFYQLKEDGNLHHGSGIFTYQDFAVWL